MPAHIGLCYNLLRLGKNDEALIVVENAYKICDKRQKLDTLNLKFDAAKSLLIRKMELQRLEKVQSKEKTTYVYLRAICNKKVLKYEEATRLYLLHR